MKKTLSLILALLMSLSTASVAFADEAAIAEEVEEVAVEETAEEVVAGPYDDAIRYLGHYGIYKGVSEDDLAAEDDVNRYQMALFAARLATGWVQDEKWEDGPQNSSEFTDLEGTPAADYYGAISYVNQAGIIEGYGDGTYGPLKGITYQDALTIVVRTLGYQNLNYPWGYIQKGVELGLTEGVVDVAYTDALTRGETAQIIYNALFAETKGGSTLGLDSFGIEFAWENVIITASNWDVFGANEKAPAGFVGFQLIEDGELDETVYYAKATDFDLEGHDDELAVGSSYCVFFEKDEESDLVSIIDYKTNYVETVWNAGKTDDEGEAQSYAIKDLLDNEYKLVDKYSKVYLGGAIVSPREEIVVVDALGGIVELKYVGSNYGIDMPTGDIVIYEEDKDGVLTIKEVVWHWNEILEAYYQVIVDEDDEIGIIYMDEEEEADLLEEIEKAAYEKVTVYEKGFCTPTTGIDQDSAYASLDIYSVSGKEYGVYEEYKLGYFSNSSIWDHNAWRASYKVEAIYTSLIDNAKEVGVEADHSTFHVMVEGVCGDCANDFAWINPYYAANLQEDGTYANGYVIYSADRYTGEIKIVKYIDDCEDADTYVGYGTVRSFNVAGEYVVINGEKLTFDYDTLEGTGFLNVTKDGKTQYKKNYSDDLREFFNQYVKYVVVDGEIVYMARSGASKANLFVVEKYAGISSDGYVVVDGYYTADATELTRVRISSIDNNYTGDLFYYLTEKKVAESFTKGTIYAVSSTEDDGSLNVQLVGEYDEVDGKTVYTVVDNYYTNLSDKYYIDCTDVEDGYILRGTDLSKASPVRTKTADTYILIGAENREGYAPIAVYTGKVTDPDWKAEGNRITGAGDDVYLLVNATWTGFGKDMTSTGLVVLLGDYYWSADFDGNNTEDWYLLGAAEYEVEVFDLYTASSIVVKATNLDLEEGYLYRTIDNTLVYDNEIVAADLYKNLKDGYQDEDAGSADYLIDTIQLGTGLIKTADVEVAVSKDVSVDTDGDGEDVGLGLSKEYKDLVGDVKAIKLITTDKKNEKVVSITDLNADVLAEMAEDLGVDTITLDGFFVYNVNTTHAYVYAYTNGMNTTGSGSTEGAESRYVIEVGTNAYIGATADADLDYVDGELASATLNSVTLSYIGKAASETHASVEFDGRYFGNAGTCDKEDWNTVVDGEEVYGSIVAGMYDNHEDEDICNLIKSVKFENLNAEVVEGEWTEVVVSFVATKGEARVPYTFTIWATIEEGAFVVSFPKNGNFEVPNFEGFVLRADANL